MAQFLRLTAMSLVLIIALPGFGRSWVSAAKFTDALNLDHEPILFATPGPEGRAPFAKAIREAQNEVRLYMYRLTEANVVSALTEARERGVKVRVLLDQNMADGAGVKKSIEKLRSAGVLVLRGSERFTMTHAKTLILDGDRALVTTMNLTWTAHYSRGLGLDIRDQSVSRELAEGFDADWLEADREEKLRQETKTDVLPIGPVMSRAADANLLWSPDNSEVRLVQMVEGATQDVEVMVENLGATPLLDTFIAAAGRGLKVRVLVPLCTTSSTPLHNWEYMQKLKKGGVEIRNMPLPYSGERPYTHAKAMRIDGRLAYLGSQNFSKNSLQRAREVGVVFDNRAAVAELGEIWQKDWERAVPPPGSVGASTCPEDLVEKSVQ